MDLFVINRHDESAAPVNEQQNLEKILKRIEKNKELRAIRKAKKKIIIANVKQERERKRKIKRRLEVQEAKQSITHDLNIDKALHDPTFDENDVDISSPKKKEKVDESADTGFTILGGEKFNKNIKKIKKVSEKNGVKYLFPVQAEVIPWLLQAHKRSNIVFPRDICVSAPTGSGKTIAFTLPVVQALMHHKIKKIRALIILPTQDLALQVFRTFKKYTQDTSLDVCIITGKNSFENEQRQLLYRDEAFGFVSKVDILICTAGRLVDHLKSTEGLDLTSLEFLVIDEADRVLDGVQHDWLYHLEKHINSEDSTLQSTRILNLLALKKHKPPQKLLFSATLSQDPEKLQKLSLFQPKLFTSIVETENPQENATNADSFIGKYTTPQELTEKYIICSIDLKPLVLYEFIRLNKLTKTMVFTHSVENTHRLAILLKSLFKDNMKIEEISSNLDVKSRNKLIEDFSAGKIDILVCTDALARGIDLPVVQCVISYSAPKHLKTYIHRAGRTARAGELGLAVTLLHKSQVNKFQSLLQQADKINMEEIKISEENLETLGEQYKQALNDLKKTVVNEQHQDLVKLKSVKRHTVKKKFK
ncbi:rna helicase [Holotrichia oblita]|uniref:Rna helicase n=1 Tax=Holotrichia oblita TaxID=644536 RepID=A0ACB9TPN8_HOLOL|nr:rna helicase [Holotrichia oblita]